MGSLGRWVGGSLGRQVIGSVGHRVAASDGVYIVSCIMLFSVGAGALLNRAGGLRGRGIETQVITRPVDEAAVAWFQVNVTHPRPKYLGPKIAVL